MADKDDHQQYTETETTTVTSSTSIEDTEGAVGDGLSNEADTQNAENGVVDHDEVANGVGGSAVSAPPEPEQTESPAEPQYNDYDAGRPVIELFVKAAVDKRKHGSCPTCHKYFLAFYILRQRGLIDLIVTTFLPENPPPEVLAITDMRIPRYPLVRVLNGYDSQGVNIANKTCDVTDEIEALLDSFDCDQMLNSGSSYRESEAEKAFGALYKEFNLFLKDPRDNSSGLIKRLHQLEEFLKHEDEDEPPKFLIADHLCRADCYLLPTLQHIRVAGKAYKGFEIPEDFTHIRAYLQNAYQTEAFKESCPADREIINHYMGKASCRPKNIAKENKGGLSGDNPKLMKDMRTLFI